MTKWFRVGKVVNTHGIRGEVRIISTTDFAEERYKIGNQVYLEHKELTELLQLTITSHRKHKNFDLLMFKGYDNVNEVEFMKGGVLKISEEQLTPLEEGEFYYHEIVGCTVMTDEGASLGKVKEILSPGANDVWVIQQTNGGKDILIPYIDDVVLNVDTKEKIVTIHLLEGLI